MFRLLLAICFYMTAVLEELTVQLEYFDCLVLQLNWVTIRVSDADRVSTLIHYS